MKYRRFSINVFSHCRAPQGARGLKFLAHQVLILLDQVAPRKGRVG